VRNNSGLSCIAAGALAGFAALALANPAAAWTRHHDRVYADSFGNLVIESAAGYKRILVGEGAMAKKLAAYTDAGQASQFDPHDAERARMSDARDCYRPPVFVKGRSYMYGLSDGEMPDLSPCR
jgi:hypothetical protein